jgi:hypothetical protein
MRKLALAAAALLFLYMYSPSPLHAYIHLFNKNTQAAAAAFIDSHFIGRARAAHRGVCVCYRILSCVREEVT